jgi:hypothetical protein
MSSYPCSTFYLILLLLICPVLSPLLGIRIVCAVYMLRDDVAVICGAEVDGDMAARGSGAAFSMPAGWPVRENMPH